MSPAQNAVDSVMPYDQALADGLTAVVRASARIDALAAAAPEAAEVTAGLRGPVSEVALSVARSPSGRSTS